MINKIQTKVSTCFFNVTLLLPTVSVIKAQIWNSHTGKMQEEIYIYLLIF